MKILVLGHKGMLGNAVLSYLASTTKHEVLSTEARYGTPFFAPELHQLSPDFIINCIGAIPQKKPNSELYTSINIELPIFLEGLGARIIHPTTDCEFSGKIPFPSQYTVTDTRDAEDEYGKSKAIISRMVEEKFQRTKLLRTSIIGHELGTNYSLLDWFLSQEGSVRGYSNHYWNGVTTLEWAKHALDLIANWDEAPVLNQIGTEEVHTKFDILTSAKEVYGKNIEIIPFMAEVTANKALKPEIVAKPLIEQLIELKKFYKK